MPADSKQQRRGRPPGSKNLDYAEAVSIPPHCPTCKSVNLEAVKGAKVIERAIAGVLPTGLEYAAVRWERMKCECGQAVAVRSYIPAKK